MDIHALKLELVQLLVSTNDAAVLTKVKRLLEVLGTGPTGRPAEDDEAMIAATATLGQHSYGEADDRNLLLNEPEPLPMLQARLKQLIDEQVDPRVLHRLLAELQGGTKEDRWKELLSERAARSEADFAAGREYSQEEVEQHLKTASVNRRSYL
jgi:hypothetical protein